MSASSDATKQAVITYPAEIPPMLKLSDQEFAREFRLLGAAKLFELGRLSSGKAAQLAGMDRVAFLYELNRISVPAINLRDEEVEAEIRAARDLARITRWVVDTSSLIILAKLDRCAASSAVSAPARRGDRHFVRGDSGQDQHL